MRSIVTSFRYVAILGVLCGMVAAIAAFGWAGVKTYTIVHHLVTGELDGMAVSLIQVMDGLLLACGLLIFALGIHELFVGAIELPPWLVIDDLAALKSKLAGIIAMVLVVTFVERAEHPGDDLLGAGISIALVCAVLVWMTKSEKA